MLRQLAFGAVSAADGAGDGSELVEVLDSYFQGYIGGDCIGGIQNPEGTPTEEWYLNGVGTDGNLADYYIMTIPVEVYCTTDGDSLAGGVILI